jgi:glycosyltransferase involved in cell wall biosynthesis
MLLRKKAMNKKQDGSVSSNKALLSVVMPIYNEASGLKQVLQEILPYCRQRGWKLILVNDGSTDGTAEILSGLDPSTDITILHHKLNRGYGGALKTGILAAETPLAITIDADGQHTLGDLDTLLKLALEKDADLVVGSRGRQGTSGWYRNLGKWLIRTFASMLMPLTVTDLNSGFKLYRTELVQRYLTLCPDSMAFSDVITLVFIKKRHLVLETPISIRKREKGKSTINTLTALQTLLEILNIAMLFNPLRIFLSLSAICILFGFGWGIPILLRARGVSVGAMLAIVTGLLFIFIGLIAEQLSEMRLGMLDDPNRGG